MRTSGGVCGRSISWLIVAAMACLARDAMAQGPALAGTVVSRQNGQPVANAAVTIEGTSVTVVANAAGRFRLDLPTGRATVVVKAPGFLELRIPDAQATSAGGAPLVIEIDPTPNFMEHVQVTATKTALSIGDVAAQADIISRSTIDSRGDQTLTQAIAHVPGAIVSTQLGIFESVMLRGMPRGDPEFTNTLLLIDGVPQTLATNGSRIVALPINDATNIEVVRGPNSALYGRTAIGGSINVRTADPTPEHQGGVDFTGGQFDMLKGVVKASGPITQWGGYYVSAAKEQNHGFFVNKTTDDYTDGNWALFGKLTFTPDSKSFGSVTVNRVNSDNSTPTNEPIIDGRLLHEIDPRFDRLTNFNIPGTNYHQGESRVTANYARQLSSIAKISEVFGYRKVQHQFLEDGDFIASPFDLEAHTVSMYPFSQELNEDIIYQELRLDVSGKVGRVKHSATVGGSYEHTSGTLDSDFIFNDEDLGGFTINYLNPVIPPRSEWQHFTGSRLFHLGNSGLFGQYMIEPTPRLILSAGGRYDRLALDNIRDGGDKLEATFDAFSPKANVTFKLLGVEGDGRPTVNVYGAYAQAFLPPRAPSSLTPANTPPNLEPEDISSYEAGVKGSLAGGRVSLEATYFHMIEDGVVLSTRQGPFFLPTNAGQLRYKGVETGISVIPSPKASLYLNAAFYRNRFGDFVIESEDGSGGDVTLTGNRLPISPVRVVNWGVTVTPVPSIQANLNVKHVGAVQATNDNSFLLDPYTVVDAAVSWKRGPLRVTLSAHNLLDREYYWNSDGETADPGHPRQLLLTLSVLGKR